MSNLKVTDGKENEQLRATHLTSLFLRTKITHQGCKHTSICKYIANTQGNIVFCVKLTIKTRHLTEDQIKLFW